MDEGLRDQLFYTAIIPNLNPCPRCQEIGCHNCLLTDTIRALKNPEVRHFLQECTDETLICHGYNEKPCESSIPLARVPEAGHCYLCNVVKTREEFNKI